MILKVNHKRITGLLVTLLLIVLTTLIARFDTSFTHETLVLFMQAGLLMTCVLLWSKRRLLSSQVRLLVSNVRGPPTLAALALLSLLVCGAANAQSPVSKLSFLMQTQGLHTTASLIQSSAITQVPTPDYVKLKNLPVIDTRKYGLKADGVTDDRAAIVSAITAAPAGGAIVTFPKGTIYISSKIAITRGKLWFKGDSVGATKIKFDITDPGNNYFFKFSGSAGANNHISDITVSDMTFDASEWTDGTTRLNTGTLQSNGCVFMVRYAATGGNFNISYRGVASGSIAYNASTAAVATAIEAISTVGVGNVTVTGTAGAYRIELSGALTGSQYAISAASVNLSGVTSSIATKSVVKLAAGASATDDIFKNCSFNIISDATNSFAPGTSGTISTYNGTTKEAEVALLDYSAAAGAKYGILLINNLTTHASNGDDQTIRGVGRLGFYYCDNIKVFNLHSKGGYGWIDWRACDYVQAYNLTCRNVNENALNCYSGTDYTPDETCEHYTVSDCNFESGEGFDCAVDHASISNITWTAIGYGDEGLDLNASHYVTATNITTIGGNHAVNFHGGPTVYDNANASYYVTVSNVTATGFLGSAISFKYGTVSNSSYRVTLGAPTAGTFTLTKGGFTTAGIAYNASAATVQTAIEGLSGVGAGNVVVRGNAGGPYTVGWKAGKEGALTGSGAGLTSGTFAIADVSQSSQNGACHDIVLSNIVAQSDLPGAVGIEASWTSTSNPVRVDNITLSNAIVIVPGRAIDASFSKNLTVRDCLLTSTGAEGFYANHSGYQNEGVRVIGSRITGVGSSTTTGAAVYFGNALRPLVQNCILTGNLTGYALKFANCKSPRALGNEIVTCAGSGIVTEWTAATNIDPDLDLRSEVSGNRILQFGVGQTGRFGISCTTSSSASGLYSGLVVKDNYVNYTTSYDVTTAGASSGTFTLTWNSNTTWAIPYNATATQVQQALEALPGVGVGNVVVTGSASDKWYVDFTGTLDNTSNALTASGAGLTGGAFAIVTHTAGKAYNITAQTAGNLTMTFVGNACGDIFPALSKLVITGANASTSTIGPNRFTTTAGGGTVVPLDGWFQEAVPASQSATEATWARNAQVFAQTYAVSAGTAQAGSSNTITLAAGASSTDNFYTGWLVNTTGNTGSGQTRVITGYVGSTKVATVSPNWVTTNPDATTTYMVYKPHVASASTTSTTLSVNRWIAPKAGTITRVWVKGSTAVTQGSITITVYKATSSIGFSAALDTTNPTFNSAIQAPGDDVFVAGDELVIRVTSSSDLLPAGSINIRAGFDVEY